MPVARQDIRDTSEAACIYACVYNKTFDFTALKDCIETCTDPESAKLGGRDNTPSTPPTAHVFTAEEAIQYGAAIGKHLQQAKTQTVDKRSWWTDLGGSGACALGCIATGPLWLECDEACEGVQGLANVIADS